MNAVTRNTIQYLGAPCLLIVAMIVLVGCQSESPRTSAQPDTKQRDESQAVADALAQDVADLERSEVLPAPSEVTPPVIRSPDPVAETTEEKQLEGNAQDDDAKVQEYDGDDYEYVEDSVLPSIPDGFVRLDPEQEVWVNTSTKQVLIGGKICFRAGALEFFACVRGSKEHESVISANALSSKLHLGLLTIGLEPGSTVRWDPEYQPATGPRIHIDVLWMDGSELRERSARDMVYNARAQKPLDVDWVFGGSILYEDPEAKTTHYLADGGEMISVSNFSTSTLDLPIESTPDNEWLVFTALTKNIPPLGTRVLLRFSEVKSGD